jgi:hypothetical protein
MSWLITPQQPIPAVIGEPFGGGYFAGYISHTADGNPTHALIVAPRATGATGNWLHADHEPGVEDYTPLPPAPPVPLTVQPTLLRWSQQALMITLLLSFA